MVRYDEQILKYRMGELVARKRKALGLSQEEFAEKLGVHIRTLSKIENGHTYASAETLCKFCEFFNLPPKAFFKIDEKISVNEQKLNTLMEMIRSGGDEKIDFYFQILNIIDTKYKNEK